MMIEKNLNNNKTVPAHFAFMLIFVFNSENVIVSHVVFDFT